jgi:hypothetical protein
VLSPERHLQVYKKVFSKSRAKFIFRNNQILGGSTKITGIIAASPAGDVFRFSVKAYPDDPDC